MRVRIGGRPVGTTNPLLNFVTIIVGAAVAAGALILGFLTFTVLAGLFLILACVVAVRIWWIRHVVLRRTAPTTGGGKKSDSPKESATIEGEFRRVNDRHDSTD